MAISKDQLTVEVVLDSSGAVKGIKDLQGQFVEFDKIVKTSSRSSDQANQTTGRMGEIFSGVSSKLSQAAAPLLALQSAVGLASAAFDAVKSTVSEFIDAYAEAEKAQVLLTRAIENSGGRIQNNAQAWGDYLDQLQEVKAVDADVLRGFVAQAIQMGFSEQQTKDLVSAMIGLSKITGDTLDTSFQKLIGTTRGMARGLSATIPELQNLTEQELRSGDAFAIVAEQTKNAASAKGTYTDAVKRAALASGELKEDIGKIIIETFNLTGAMKSSTDTINSVRSALASVDVKSLKDNFVELVKSAGPFLFFIGAATAGVSGFAAAAMAAVAPVLLITAKILLIVGAVTAVITVIEMLSNNFGILKDVLSIAANTIALAFMSMARNAAEALAGLFSLFGENNPFAKAANQVAAGLNKSVESLKDNISKSAGNIRTEFNKTFTADVFKQIGNAIDGFRGKVDQTKKSLGELGKEGARAKVIDDKALEKADAALKDIIKQTDALKLATATAGQDEIQQVRLKTAEQMRLIAEKYKELDQQGILNEKHKEALNAQRDAVQASHDRTLQVIEQNKMLEEQKKITGELKSFTDNITKAQEQSRAANLGTFDVIRNQSAVELEKLATLEKQLDIAGGLTEEKKAEIAATREAIKEIESQKMGTAIMSGVTSAINAAQGGADALMTNIINQVGEAFGPEGKMIAGIVNLARKGKEFTKQLGLDFMQLFADLPKLVTEGLVGLVEGFTTGLTNFLNDPNKVMGFIENLVKLMPTVMAAFTRALPQLAIAMSRPSFWISVAKAFAIGIRDAMIETFKSLKDAIGELAREAGKTLEKAFLDSMKVFENVFVFVRDGFSKAWDWLKEQLSTIGTIVWEKIKGAFNDLGDTLAKFGEDVWNGIKDIPNRLLGGFKNLGSAIWDGFKEGLDNIGGAIKKFLGLSEGGIVPGMALVAGDSSKNDTVPALLSPGEAVIPRSLMDNPQINRMISDLLNNKQMPISMNQQMPRIAMASGGIVSGLRGGTSYGDTNLNVVLQIETKEPLDEGFIRQRLVPALKAELKASSLRGDFVLSAKGVRG